MQKMIGQSGFDLSTNYIYTHPFMNIQTGESG